ncbi:MAG: twin-arginine translocase TatA/TatE family subunit [Vicingaceae bacterium]|jgi:sec-independent protein translocase protein TatA|tara:strand:+ start:258 stop:449 length:192 start_codon:yes stop_codon:yes gene_type:complete
METTVFEVGMFGPTQIVLIVVAVILLFGAKKIPELMKGVGKGIKEFKDATNEDDKDNTPNKSN